MSAELDLFHVSDDFASLLRLRDIMLSEGEDVGPLEQQLAEYFSGEITKDRIDVVIGALRHAEVMESAAKAEADRCLKMARSYQTQRDWLKGTVQQVMTMAGKKWLEGKTSGYLLLKGNGGKPAVEITDASLIPEELVQYTGTISGRAWAILKYASDMFPARQLDFEEWTGRHDVQMERIPHKGRIAAAIEAGEAVPGARLAERGAHVEVR